MQGNKADDSDLPDQKSIALTLARCACNNHTICDDELRPIGEDRYLDMPAVLAGSVRTAQQHTSFLLLLILCHQLHSAASKPRPMSAARAYTSLVLVCAGVGLFPTGALVNHSCTPNAMQSFSQQRIIFRALQPIPAGTEITISYIELAATRSERRQQLLDQYYFDIDCDWQVGPTPNCYIPTAL